MNEHLFCLLLVLHFVKSSLSALGLNLDGAPRSRMTHRRWRLSWAEEEEGERAFEDGETAFKDGETAFKDGEMASKDGETASEDEFFLLTQ
jgi:hypothetical protein